LFDSAANEVVFIALGAMLSIQSEGFPDMVEQNVVLDRLFQKLNGRRS
jgi:hypothetical protein